MAAMMTEAAKATQPQLATPLRPAAAPRQQDRAFDWEEREHSGDAFAFRLWVLWSLVMWLLALSDGLRAILGW